MPAVLRQSQLGDTPLPHHPSGESGVGAVLVSPPSMVGGGGTRMLEVRGLQCERDGRPLFSNLSFNLAAGQLLHIEGANGCGKSTLLRALAGLLSPTAGTLLWRGQPLAAADSDYRAALCFIGHKAGLKSELSPLANLRHLQSLAATPATEERLLQVLAGVGLAGHEQLAVARLSAGQQRRVALARLWLSKAPLWLLDEPFTALDKKAVAGLCKHFATHLAAGGAIVMASHQEPPHPELALTRLPLADYRPVMA